MSAYMTPTAYPWEVLTDLQQGMHPEGFYTVSLDPSTRIPAPKNRAGNRGEKENENEERRKK